MTPERKAELNARLAKERPFSLPPGITFKKEQRSGGLAYVFRHHRLGELGHIQIRGQPDGQSLIMSLVAGDPDDPMTAQRAALFKPLADEMTQRMEKVLTGKTTPSGINTPVPPVHREYDGEVVESKCMQCERCDALVALLIFAPNATDHSHMEDYYRKMHGQIKQQNLPTWIIGPPLGSDPYHLVADIWKVWPEREPVEQLSPDVFNARLDGLITGHCG